MIWIKRKYACYKVTLGKNRAVYNEKGIQAILDIAEVSRKRIKYANV